MSELILAIDPGPEKSGWCLLNSSRVVLGSGVAMNAEMLESVSSTGADKVVCEGIASYGMPVGKETFETCIWIGRFQQAFRAPDEFHLIYRKDVKLFLCGSLKAKDSNIRQAILDLFPRTGGGKTPQIGTKSQPGPLFGVSTHAWSALAVALTAQGRAK